MKVPYSSLKSHQLDHHTLPSIISDKNHLPSTITNYVTEVNQELINLEKEQFGISLRSSPKINKLKRISTIKRRDTHRTSSSFLPVVMRLSSNLIKPIYQSTFITDKIFKSSTCLSNPMCIKLKINKLLEELKSIHEESSYMNQNLLSDMNIYQDTGKRVNEKFKKIKSTKQKLLLMSHEYLIPEMNNPLYQKHANEFYSYLDQVIEKVNGATSLDLFKKMKLLNEEKENSNQFVWKSQKNDEKIGNLLEENNQIKKRLTKIY